MAEFGAEEAIELLHEFVTVEIDYTRALESKFFSFYDTSDIESTANQILLVRYFIEKIK